MNKWILIENDKKRRAEEAAQQDNSPKRTRQGSTNYDKEMCIFCQAIRKDKKTDETLPLQNATLPHVGRAWLAMATVMHDNTMTTRLGTGDIVAADTKYHRPCLPEFYSKLRSWRRAQINPENVEEEMKSARVFLELIEDMKEQMEGGKCIFPLSRLVRDTNLRRLEFGLTSLVHATRLKEKILEEFQGDLVEHGTTYERKNLVIREGLNSLVKDAMKEREYKDDVKAIARVAKVIRGDMFDHKGFKFSGNFSGTCQLDSVPTSLKTLVSMILSGPSLREKDSQTSVSISQLLLFNSRKKDKEAKYISHSKEREPPLPVYLGLLIHSQTRSKKLIQKLFQLGFSISYFRVREIEQRLASSLCEQYAKDQAVIPALLKADSFTLAAVDNIDHNLSSTTATTSFHGTSISYHQHITENSTDRAKFILSEQN